MLTQTRLGIPVLMLDEALHGLMLPGATSFPQAIALGSTWDITLVEQIFAVAAREGRARGIRQVLFWIWRATRAGEEPKHATAKTPIWSPVSAWRRFSVFRAGAKSRAGTISSRP
ncbi:MAG: hypothetical protein ONB48_21210 [candidate division KSB1 bacterium]|nr:hypothetical protein [candidate division KSB1 bacterium]MDZ7288169.1 hypothetical protein [candidate division KSB1 bacterium]MDZ7300318.1 hypothetical protein [candidate division KSB1 bacterium]MDZ7308676.1 hypothetical protein [candidate division KSB1 bacterium]MDZ7351318.1 hypothetical protein [candidate division KSB1 bacterium]